MNHEEDRREVARWAFNLLPRSTYCILDTETTGLDNSAEICQISVIDPLGNPLLNTLVKPTVKIAPDASRVHHISDEMVADAPTFEHVFLDLLKAVGDRELVIYNAAYDIRLIRQSLKPYGIFIEANLDKWLNGAPIHCAMLRYSSWVGEWNSYHGNYKWQRLPGGDHSALGDCIATLGVIKRMAESHEAEPVQQLAIAEVSAVQQNPDTPYDDIPF